MQPKREAHTSFWSFWVFYKHHAVPTCAPIMPGRDFRKLIDAARSEEINGEVLASKALHGKAKKAYSTADYAVLLTAAKSKRVDGAKRVAKMKGLKVSGLISLLSCFLCCMCVWCCGCECILNSKVERDY